MNIWKLTPVRAWAARGMSALVLTSGLMLAQPAYAAEDVATITAYASGAPETAWIVVQWQSPVDASWHTVDGWQGDLDTTQDGVSYKQWAVSSANYGQGPFRWVVYVEQGGAVWATSEPFTLPTDDAVHVDTSLNGATAGAETTSKTSAPATAAETGSELAAWIEELRFDAQGAGTARISLLVGGASPTTYVGVQYLDAAGVWQDVTGWQTQAVINEQGLAFVQWGVSAQSFGQGPLRWAVYSGAGGSLIGVSPSFYLPTDSGVDLVMHL
ncbi:MAG TPA: hypothetical protein PK954_17740 [Anaerolineales bacterium]|nr:hypothetical protein [Anaerolineales bacterium]HRF48053.1 hypothetical protein [Anaerolineales bacterium]